jgi:CAAX protease family protein
VQQQDITVRAWRITFFFLIGVTLVEGIPLVLGFAGNARRFISSSPGTPLAWILALVIAATFIWLTVRRHQFIREHLLTFSLLKALAIPMALVSGVFEEVFFRSFIMNLAIKGGWSTASQIFFSAITFGLAHGIWGLFGKNLRMAIGAIIATGLLGAALAVVYVVGGRSVAPCALAHVLINLVIEPWLILSAAANRWGTS